jgi:hypothetical protein
MGKESKNLIAYCGLYCGDCHAFTGRIPDLAKELRKEFRAARYDKFAAVISKYPIGKPLKYYDQCYDLLGLVMKFRCKKGCRQGCGPLSCKVRKCRQKKGIEGCWECEEFETCSKLDFLKTVHGDAHIRNLRAVKRKGPDGFVKSKRYWYSEVRK